MVLQRCLFLPDDAARQDSLMDIPEEGDAPLPLPLINFCILLHLIIPSVIMSCLFLHRRISEMCLEGGKVENFSIGDSKSRFLFKQTSFSQV